MANDVTYSTEIQKMILANLDGWRIGDNAVDIELEEEINPFMTEDEASSKANKSITVDECKLFYEEALDMAYMHTNRLNIDDLSLTSSNLNKIQDSNF